MFLSLSYTQSINVSVMSFCISYYLVFCRSTRGQFVLIKMCPLHILLELTKLLADEYNNDGVWYLGLWLTRPRCYPVYHIHSNRCSCPNRCSPPTSSSSWHTKNWWNRLFLYQKCTDLKSDFEIIIIHQLYVLHTLSALLEWIRYCQNLSTVSEKELVLEYMLTSNITTLYSHALIKFEVVSSDHACILMWNKRHVRL